MSLKFEQPSRATEVVREIDRVIRSRALNPGDKIATKGELQENYGVARATINEAIKLLLDRGRITVKPGPNGGLFVAAANPELQLGRFLLAVGEDSDKVADAVALREYLETLIVQEAVKHRTADDIRELRGCLMDLADACGYPDRFFDVGLVFHRRIGMITPNLILRSTYCGLIDFTKSRVSGLYRPDDTEISVYHQDRVRIHADIVDVIEQRDLLRVIDVIAAHSQPRATARA